MSDVPDEVLREILSRLPVAPLLRFRCVSKSWKALIDSQEFITHHLNHSRKKSSNLNLILSGRYDLYSADFALLDETNQANFQQLSYPLKEPGSGTSILGSCDGLLVLRHDDETTMLWNPCVRSFHEIPCFGMKFWGNEEESFYGFGFGYDFVSDDYKLIHIVQSSTRESDEFYSEVQVYSLKSGSWRTVPDFPYHIQPSDGMTKGVLANGAFHWMVTGTVKWGSDHDLVAAWDLGTEEYSLVPLPKFGDDDDTPNLEVVVLGGCLSLVSYVDEVHVDLWVMKEYGVQESWSILFGWDIYDYGATMRPLAYSRCGRKVLLVVDGDVLRWFDLDKNSTDAPMVQMPSENIEEMCTCSQSLVLLNKGAPDFNFVAKKKRKRKDKKGSSRKRKYFQAWIEGRVLPAIGRPEGHE